MLPFNEDQIETLQIIDLGLGKRIYTKKMLDKFASFQDSQGTRRANLAKTAELAYNGLNERGEWGLVLGVQALNSMIDNIGMSFIPKLNEETSRGRAVEGQEDQEE
jgi:hypothetical protein